MVVVVVLMRVVFIGLLLLMLGRVGILLRVVAVGLVGWRLGIGVVLGIGLLLLWWVAVRAPIIVLAWVMMAIVGLLPRCPRLRWRIEVSLALWLWRRSWRRLLSLPVVCIVRRWWGLIALRVWREVRRSCIILVCCHIGYDVVVQCVEDSGGDDRRLYTSVEIGAVEFMI